MRSPSPSQIARPSAARPATSDADRRPILAALLSAVVPGLGQAYEGRLLVAAVLFVPIAALALGTGFVVGATRLPELAGSLVLPGTLSAFLTANVALLLWRVIAVMDAWRGPRRPRIARRGLEAGGRRAAPSSPANRGRTARAFGLVGLVVVLVLTAAPHAFASWYGAAASSAVSRIFTAEDADPLVGTPGETPGPTLPGDASAIVGADSSPAPSLEPSPSPTPTPTPPLTGRVNVLLLGIDSGPGRNQALTDTMIVVSLDPVGRTVSMISVPRDTVNAPLGDGRFYQPKLNSLLSFAERNPGAFAGKKPIRALKDALGALLGIRIRYYASVNLPGFITVIDSIGGVGVYVKEPLYDHRYREYGFRGFSIDVGCHHLDGRAALAYARIRYSIGQNDFTRAARQQQVLVAARDRVVRQGLLLDVPKLLDAVGDALRTDIPPELVPRLADYATQVSSDRVAQAVVTWPLVASGSNQFGSVLIPDLVAIRRVADRLFVQPGVTPIGWPEPTLTPAASPSPKPTKAPKPTPVCQ